LGTFSILKSDNMVPIRDIHIDPLKLTRKKHPIMCDEMSDFLKFVHTLFQPMLGRDNILEMLPLIDDYLCQMTKF